MGMELTGGAHDDKGEQVAAGCSTLSGALQLWHCKHKGCPVTAVFPITRGPHTKVCVARARARACRGGHSCLRKLKGKAAQAALSPAAMPASLVVAALTRWPGTFRHLANTAYTEEGTSSASAAATALDALTTATFRHQLVQATPKAAPVPAAENLFTRD